MDVFGAVDVVKVLSRIIGGCSAPGASVRSDDHVGKRTAGCPAGSLSLSRERRSLIRPASVLQ
jgi:hypothetical protein